MMPSPVPQSAASTLEWARYYVARGWSAVPARLGTKFPAGEWLRYQTNLPTDAQLADWFGQQGFVRLGLVTGKNSGIFVADFDGAAGMDTLAALDAKGFPQSIRQFTPSGGCHVLLKHPGLYIPTRKWRESPWLNTLHGMDIRGDGGFIMAAPSIGAEYGRYDWDVDAHPDLATLADAPQAFIDLISQATTASGTGKDLPVTRAPGPLGLDLGQIIDGRETYMRNTVMAVTRGLFDRLQRMPTEQEVFEEGWPQYAARVDLSRPGRGENEFRAKVKYTLARIQRGAVPGFTSPAAGNEPGGQAPGGGETAEAKAEPLWVDALGWDAAAVPKRPWIAPGYLMRGSVTVLSGQGAGGKSSLVVAQTISLATGKALGAFTPTEPMIVINYNTEDDMDEQRRRYGAALKASETPVAAVSNRVIRCGPNDIGTLFARDPNTGAIAPTAAMQALEALCVNSGADVLFCDPLAELHNAEENDNTAMRAVIAAFRGLAKRLNIAVEILHHDRKGTNAPGDMDRMRGASAISGAVRVMLTLTPMNQEEAEKFGIPPDQRRRHFRVDGAKSNYAPAQEAEWFRLDAHELPNGEHVAAAMPWAPPSAFEGISMATCVAILDVMQRGINGAPFGSRGKALGELYAVMAAEPFKLAPGKVSALLGAWTATGVVADEEGCDSPNSRHPRRGFKVDTAKLSEMRRGV